MIWLVLGVLLWSGVHFIPSLAPGLKVKLSGSIGVKGYKGAFALSIVGSVFLIVIGWQAVGADAVYAPPEWAFPVTTLLMVLAFILFGAAKQPTRLKRIIRHPQLTGMAVWGVAHLLSNGDSRSIVLFGGLGIWAIIEMFLINAREGEWVKPEAPSILVEIRGLLISVVIFVIAIFLHPYFAGVSPMPH